MGAVYSLALRKINRINVENRAEKAIQRKKPVYSPLHPSSEKYYKEVVKATPKVGEQLIAKDLTLDGYLKDVYVRSTNAMPEIKRDPLLLPKNRLPVEEYEIGFWEPSEVPNGFCTLRQAIEFLSYHNRDPGVWTADKIGEKYKLDPKIVGYVLEHYKPFNVKLPPSQKSSNPFSASYLISGLQQKLMIGKKETNSTNEDESKEQKN